MTISIVYSIMTTIRVGGAKSCPEGSLVQSKMKIWIGKNSCGTFNSIDKIWT